MRCIDLKNHVSVELLEKEGLMERKENKISHICDSVSKSLTKELVRFIYFQKQDSELIEQAEKQ